MRALPLAVTDGLARGRVSFRIAILLDLVEGLYGYWDGLGTIDIAGVIYAGFGKLLSVSDLTQGAGLQAQALVVTVSSLPEIGLTSDVLSEIESYGYKNRPIVISAVWFDIETGAVLEVERLAVGLIDRIDRLEDATFRLEGHVETRALDNRRVQGRLRSHEAHQSFFPGDRGLEYAAVVQTKQVSWGRFTQ